MNEWKGTHGTKAPHLDHIYIIKDLNRILFKKNSIWQPCLVINAQNLNVYQSKYSFNTPLSEAIGFDFFQVIYIVEKNGKLQCQ